MGTFRKLFLILPPDRKILSCEWIVNGKIASPRCHIFLARIDDSRFSQPLTTAYYKEVEVEKDMVMSIC
jgi:hypothetical protein